MLEAWRKADARAERYHSLLLREEKPAETEALAGLREKLLAAVVEQTADPSVYAVVARAWAEVAGEDKS